jgi:glycyl-tRNA synthetase beta chain
MEYIMIVSSKSALLEIGTEEIPCGCIDPALSQMEILAKKNLGEMGLSYNSILVFATPRRLVLKIDGLPEKSDDKMEEIFGPPLKAAKNSEENWTQAAIGFASKNFISPEKLLIKNTDKGGYLYFVKKIKGERTEKILMSLFPEIIKNISFPKTMMWNEAGFKFVRPIRKIAALYGERVVKFQIAGVVSSNWTVGLFAVDDSKIKIKDADGYLAQLEKHNVIVNQKNRREMIKLLVKETAEKIGTVVEDESLFEEINYLVEYPTPILCSFEKKYLELPQEVLTVCMKKKQKCFAVNDKNGKISNYFVGVKNGIAENLETVREGYEKVVGARLADAEFFYRNDLRNGIGNNVEKLKGLTFHKEIGSVYEKVERIKSLILFLNSSFSLNYDEKVLEKTAFLLKADLVSEMVFEYPELQGIMGKLYSLNAGENHELSDAIEQHYRPLYSGAKLPENKIAVLCSIADKIDSLAANFSVGLVPSSSADPYGLRRSAAGIIRIIMENFPVQDFTPLVEKSLDILSDKIKNNPKFKEAKEKVMNFLWQRIENIFETEGYSFEEIKAVVNAAKMLGFKEIGLIKNKIDAFRKAKVVLDFTAVSGLFKRINNILLQIEKQNLEISKNVDESLLNQDSEKKLFIAISEADKSTKVFFKNRDYDKIYDKIVEIKPFIDDFFEKTMVMVRDENVKRNRAVILKNIRDIFKLVADFSIVQDN